MSVEASKWLRQYFHMIAPIIDKPLMQLNKIRVQMVAIPLKWMIEIAQGIAHDEAIFWELKIMILIKEQPFASRWRSHVIKLEFKRCPENHLIELTLSVSRYSMVLQTELHIELKISLFDVSAGI